MHLKVLRFLKQCLSSDLLLDSLWCVELQTPHKQKEMRRNCHRKILEKKISVLMKVFGSQILVCHDVRLQVEIPPIQLGFVAEKSKFHTCTKGGRCVIIFLRECFFLAKSWCLEDGIFSFALSSHSLTWFSCFSFRGECFSLLSLQFWDFWK